MSLRGLPISDGIMLMSGCYTGYKCVLYTHSHTYTHTQREKKEFLAVDPRMLFRGLIEP